MWELERFREQWKFLLEVFYLPWMTLLKVKSVQILRLGQPFLRVGFLVYKSESRSSSALEESMSKISLLLCDWFLVCVVYLVTESIFIPWQSSLRTKRKCLSLCEFCAFLISYLQHSVNISWINEWTNEWVLVTEATKTNETWSLPLEELTVCRTQAAN